MPRDTDLAAIKKAISDIGFNVIRAAQLRRNKSKEFLPLYLVCINPQDLKGLHQVSVLLNYEVKIENYKSHHISQCHRCQNFFHASENCKLDPACVKCAGKHLSTECPNKSRDEVKCINCGMNHTANFKGCPKHPANTRKSKSQNNTGSRNCRKPSRTQAPTHAGSVHSLSAPAHVKPRLKLSTNLRSWKKTRSLSPVSTLLCRPAKPWTPRSRNSRRSMIFC